MQSKRGPGGARQLLSTQPPSVRRQPLLEALAHFLGASRHFILPLKCAFILTARLSPPQPPGAHSQPLPVALPESAAAQVLRQLELLLCPFGRPA